MKQIIDIPDELFNIFKKHGIMAFDYFNEYDKDQIAIAITHGTPYEERPQGDCISREALKKAIEEVEDNYDGYEPNDLGKFMSKVYDLIDNAMSMHYTFLPQYQADLQGAYDCGYTKGLSDEKSDIITLIANEYTEHGELIPNWLTIGETKVADKYKKGIKK